MQELLVGYIVNLGILGFEIILNIIKNAYSKHKKTSIDIFYHYF